MRDVWVSHHPPPTLKSRFEPAIRCVSIRIQLASLRGSIFFRPPPGTSARPTKHPRHLRTPYETPAIQPPAPHGTDQASFLSKGTSARPGGYPRTPARHLRTPWRSLGCSLCVLEPPHNPPQPPGSTPTTHLVVSAALFSGTPRFPVTRRLRVTRHACMGNTHAKKCTNLRHTVSTGRVQCLNLLPQGPRAQCGLRILVGIRQGRAISDNRGVYRPHDPHPPPTPSLGVWDGSMGGRPGTPPGG